MKIPPSIDAEKCLSYRKRAKRGEYLRPEESGYCELMLKHYPKWYEDTDKIIFEETKPFGAI